MDIIYNNLAIHHAKPGKTYDTGKIYINWRYI